MSKEETMTEERGVPDLSFVTTDRPGDPIKLHLVFGQKREIFEIPDKRWMLLVAAVIDRLAKRP